MSQNESARSPYHNEKDKLGWCIDTKGRGFTEELHAHSCKPTNKDASFVFDDDVLFRYNDVSGQIRSATYANKCAQIPVSYTHLTLPTICSV